MRLLKCLQITENCVNLKKLKLNYNLKKNAKHFYASHSFSKKRTAQKYKA